ncbi:phosphatase PAP2 family protein [Piscirickettsia litoralis]|uniref:Inositolphosphotransferase Aur1/Ipt1 domain-containing protein n=1 Tax=Piscirickettsia litoralis TaxID=1891921 RepID=A0ABX3A4V8_9GAMM|nr:phosphatase PAP2 family protein [Piscirickettsia litoralis]ODN43892.1 hypothetical protein BGC07_14610 [Piscirickettsia litoralis]
MEVSLCLNDMSSFYFDKIRNYFIKNLSCLDKLSVIFSFVLILLSLVVYYINYKYTHYLSLENPPLITNFILICLALVLLSFSLGLFGAFPKIGLMFKLISIYLIGWVAIFCAYNIQFTPFKNIDSFLYQTDLSLGLNQNNIISWVYQHHYLHYFLTIVYNSLEGQALILPILACFIINRKDVEMFLLKFSILNLIGCVIYYFWPTASPASILEHKYLLSGQISLALQFKQIHQGVLPTVVGNGLISFPSFHVIWSTLFTFFV